MKAYVIQVNEVVSLEQSQDCIESFKKNHIYVEIFYGIYKHNLNDTWNAENLVFFHKLKESKKRDGVRGCFLSHYLLWKKCIELNEAILILEHDAISLRPLPKNILDCDFEVLNLDYASRQIKDYWRHVEKDFGEFIYPWPSSISKGYSGYNKSSIPGIHAYIIKPQGAAKLIEFTKSEGVLPADIQINSKVLDLRYTETSYAKINPKYWELPDGITRAKPGSTKSLTENN